jgi:hypothetical protein
MVMMNAKQLNELAKEEIAKQEVAAKVRHDELQARLLNFVIKCGEEGDLSVLIEDPHLFDDIRIKQLLDLGYVITESENRLTKDKQQLISWE